MPFMRSGLVVLTTFSLIVQVWAEQIPLTVKQALELAGLPETALAAWIAPVGRDAPVLSLRAEQAFQPASTIKTLTALVALDTLGPNWRGQTRLLTVAPVSGTGNEQTLQGDLILRGEANVDFDIAALDTLLRRVRASGIRRIAGDVIVDRSYFRPGRMDLGLPPFDEAPEFRYNAIPDALFLNGHLLSLELVADTERLRVLSAPELPGVSVRSEMSLVEASCNAWDDHWRLPRVERSREGHSEIVLQGAFPRACTVSTQVAILDRDAYVERLLRARWAALGGLLDGKVRFQDQSEPTGLSSLRELAVVRSRSLAELVREINKRSDNPITRMIYLVLGARVAEPGETTAQAAERFVRRWLAERGIATSGLVLDNGSGLSRTERIAPRTLGLVLQQARRHRWWPEFAYGLPVAGQDGSLARRLKDSAAARSDPPARLKTGTLRDVGALAGYLTAADGREYVFVAMVNDPKATTAAAHPVLDALVEWAARAGWQEWVWSPTAAEK